MNPARQLILFWLLLASATLISTTGFAKSTPTNPGLRSASVLVTDSAGNIIYGKDIDTVRPIASISDSCRVELAGRIEYRVYASGQVNCWRASTGAVDWSPQRVSICRRS